MNNQHENMKVDLQYDLQGTVRIMFLLVYYFVDRFCN